MSAASEAYTIFTFPPEVPLSWKLIALPDCASFIGTGKYVQVSTCPFLPPPFSHTQSNA